MIYVRDGLYVTIEEDTVATAPLPKPLDHGFSRKFAYLALGAFSLSESGEAYFILANDRDEIWFISNRHLRVHNLLPGSLAFRLRLQKTAGPAAGRNGHPAKPARRARSVRA